MSDNAVHVSCAIGCIWSRLRCVIKVCAYSFAGQQQSHAVSIDPFLLADGRIAMEQTPNQEYPYIMLMLKECVDTICMRDCTQHIAAGGKLGIHKHLTLSV